MRNLNELNKYRAVKIEIELYGMRGNEVMGFFELPMGNTVFRVIATNGFGWDHVSVSLKHRCPTWEEMDKIYRRFFLPHERAMQVHVPADQHISNHPYCLHIWRPHDSNIPIPPADFVGIKK